MVSYSEKKYDNVLLRCLEKDDANKDLKELYDRPIGVHFGGDTTTHIVLRK